VERFASAASEASADIGPGPARTRCGAATRKAARPTLDPDGGHAPHRARLSCSRSRTTEPGSPRAPGRLRHRSNGVKSQPAKGVSLHIGAESTSACLSGLPSRVARPLGTTEQDSQARRPEPDPANTGPGIPPRPTTGWPTVERRNRPTFQPALKRGGAVFFLAARPHPRPSVRSTRARARGLSGSAGEVAGAGSGGLAAASRLARER
jgi:hypothetical protein